MDRIASKLLTVEEAAKLLGLKPSRLRDLVFRRKVPVVRVGRSVYFTEKALSDWISAHAEGWEPEIQEGAGA